MIVQKRVLTTADAIPAARSTVEMQARMKKAERSLPLASGKYLQLRARREQRGRIAFEDGC